MIDEQRSQTGWIGVLGLFRDRNYESGYEVLIELLGTLLCDTFEPSNPDPLQGDGVDPKTSRDES